MNRFLSISTPTNEERDTTMTHIYYAGILNNEEWIGCACNNWQARRFRNGPRGKGTYENSEPYDVWTARVRAEHEATA